MEMKKNQGNSTVKMIVIGCCGVMLGLLIGMGILLLALNQTKEQPDTPSQQTTTEKGQGDKTDRPEGPAQTPSDLPQLAVLSVEEKGEAVVVSTTYGAFRYPFAFSDLIIVEPQTNSQDAKLDFYADIDGTKVILFTIWYGKNEGLAVGSLKIADWAEDLSVSVVFYDEPENLKEDQLTTYYATKETFNDIVQSFSENEHYTPA